MAPKKEKTPPKPPTRDERIAAFKEKINKRMGEHAQLKRASEYILPYVHRRMPTGLLSLDVALRGGFPCGGVSQIVGAKNAGKSYLTWQVVRQQQFYKGDAFKCLLAMTELRADRTQARLAGVKISLGDFDIQEIERARAFGKVPLSKEEREAWKKAAAESYAAIADWQTMKPKERNTYLETQLDDYEFKRLGRFTEAEKESLREEVGTIDEVHGDSAEKLFDVILDAVRDNIYHLIIIDSFGSIMSAAEAENESLLKKTYSGASKPITEFLRKLSALLTMDDQYGKARDVCIIGINQIRDAIGEPNLEYRSVGGRALEHAKFVDLYLQSGKQDGYEDSVLTTEGYKKRWVQTGKYVSWKIEKGKAGIHEGDRGDFLFDFRTCSGDFYRDTIKAGVDAGVIEEAGSWHFIPMPGDPGKYLLRQNSRDHFREALIADAVKCAEEDNPNSIMNYIRIETLRKRDIFINYGDQE